ATNSNESSQVGRYIQPGQAFFVKNTTSGTAGTLTFQEAHKATTNANVFRTATTPALSVALYDPNELAIGGYPIDATKAVFSSDYTNELGLGDATKLEAAGENIAWFRNNTKLAIDAAAPVTTSDELAMKTLRLGANKSYTFKVNATNFDTSLTGYLVDQYLNSQTQLDLTAPNFVSFATTADAASYGADRFKVIFSPSSALNNEEWNSKSLRIYPNPLVDNQFTIAVSPSITDNVAITIYNMIGQSVYKQTAMAINNGIVVRPSVLLKAGVYMVEMKNNGKTNTQKIIIK
ncbi:MAG: T9SS type A sorting domain-containing protein, partial [Flavobacteriaceae bacterium]|nr:T9SS type A sorting domain-containing protein [Flavobacteriaceae bacterium]